MTAFRRSITRRRMVQSTVAGAGLAALGGTSALASGGAPAVVSRVSTSQDTQKVRALMWSNGPIIDGHFENRMKAFNESHSGSIEVDLQFLPWDQYWQKLQLGYSSGDVYDVYFWDVQAYGHFKNDLLLNLQPYIDSTDLLDPAKYPTTLFEPWKLDGTNMYAVPENLQTIALYYNKTLFDADGLAVPDETWNYDQIVEAATTLTKRDGDRVNQWGMNVGNLGIWWGTQTLSWARGDAFFDKVLEPTKFQFSNPANVESLDFVRSLVNDHKVAPTPAIAAESGDTTGFQSGRVGLVVEGSWQISAFAELPFEWGVTSIPMVGTERVPAYFMGGWVIAKASGVPDAAFEWARWSASDYQDEMAAEHDWLPILTSARDSAATTDGLPEGYRAVIDSLTNARIGDVYSSNTQQIWVEVFEPKLTELLNENKSAEEIAAQMDEGANALLAG
jgi:multiple sugar transport system substrate-binding protein